MSYEEIAEITKSNLAREITPQPGAHQAARIFTKDAWGTFARELSS
jgi:hypothetical protein